MKRSVTMPDADGVSGAADSTPPRHKTQLQSDDSRSLCCEVDASSWLQPSGQQMPSIAFRDANTTKSTAATRLRTTLIILCFCSRSPCPTIRHRYKNCIKTVEAGRDVSHNGRRRDLLQARCWTACRYHERSLIEGYDLNRSITNFLEKPIER